MCFTNGLVYDHIIFIIRTFSQGEFKAIRHSQSYKISTQPKSGWCWEAPWLPGETSPNPSVAVPGGTVLGDRKKAEPPSLRHHGLKWRHTQQGLNFHTFIRLCAWGISALLKHEHALVSPSREADETPPQTTQWPVTSDRGPLCLPRIPVPTDLGKEQVACLCSVLGLKQGPWGKHVILCYARSLLRLQIIFYKFIIFT